MKEAAYATAQQLLDALRADQDHPGKAAAIDHAEHLQRAVHAFHMEGVRFRSYTLHRMLTQDQAGFGDASRQAYEALRRALEAIGLATK